MKLTQGKIHYNWFIIGILTATFWLTVSANYDDYPTKCPKQDPMNYTVLLPHETDCDKYYACSNGRKILMHCPLMDDEGNRLYFSQKLHVCVFPEQSDCTPQTTTTEQTSKPTEETTTRIPSTTTTKRPTTTTEKPLPPTTTTKKPTTTTQLPTTTSESTTASEVVSTNNPPTTTIVTSTTEQSTSTSGTSTNEPSITTTELPSSSTVLSTNNPPTTTSEITSTTGQLTSSTGSSTDRPWTTKTSTASTPLELCTESTTGVYFAHESYPHLYYECNYGDLIRRECEDNSNFDVTDQLCVESLDTNYSGELSEAPTTIEPTNSSEISSPCNSDGSNSTCGRHPHECDCHKFYVCINGDAVLRMCPSSLSFNPTLNECDLSENVECGGDNGGGDNGNGDGNTSTTPIPTQCPPDNTGWAVQLPHETNCSLFYKCNWGEKFVLPCRPGLHFNPKLQVCDWPCSAGCTAEGGDGSNTCNSPHHPGSEKPHEEKPFLRFVKLSNFDDDDDDRSLDN